MIKDTYIRARVSKQEKEKYIKLADKKGMKLSEILKENY